MGLVPMRAGADGGPSPPPSSSTASELELEVRPSSWWCGGRAGGAEQVWLTVLPATSKKVNRRAPGVSRCGSSLFLVQGVLEESDEPMESIWSL